MHLQLRILPVSALSGSAGWLAALAAGADDPLLSAWQGPAVDTTVGAAEDAAEQPVLRGRGAAVAFILGAHGVEPVVAPDFAQLQARLTAGAAGAASSPASAHPTSERPDSPFPAPQFAQAADLWEQLVASISVTADSLSLADFQAASGLAAPLGFFSFSFSPADAGVLLVAQQTLVITARGAWELTVVAVDQQQLAPLGQLPDFPEGAAELPSTNPAPTQMPSPAQMPAPAQVEDTSADAFVGAVKSLVARLQAGEAQKTVLARPVVVRAAAPLELGMLLAKLTESYPTTWKFAVAGLVGATPEMLADVRQGRVFSRVLAGTCAVGAEAYLASSPKDQAEHKFAADSVVAALTPWCGELSVSPEPFILRLPNVSHLATDVQGPLAGGASRRALWEILGSLHPTAAVCGTPREAAFNLISELEPVGRERYAAPVGWIDGAGNGAGALALRCGQLETSLNEITLWAGCGIMPLSTPESELAETRAKLRPLLAVFGY